MHKEVNTVTHAQVLIPFLFDSIASEMRNGS